MNIWYNKNIIIWKENYMIKLAILTPQNSYENIKKCLKGIECEIKYILW